MLSLIEALSIAKKELDSQGARVQQLEDMLKQERSAREDAEERARKLEQHAVSRPVSAVEEEPETPMQTPHPGPSEQQSSLDTNGELDARTKLQQNLEQVLGDMQRLKSDVDKFQRRAETAEADAVNARKSLAEMIDQIREENEKAESVPQQSHDRRDRAADPEDTEMATMESDQTSSKSMVKSTPQANGHVRAPRLPEHLERAVATVLRNRSDTPDALAQSAPYVSMLGVVLIGVGLMAYLNSWQKSER
jgi:DNA repair exonuclease SbcCD ATPase subunit